jgi:hypothetical protein
MFHASPGSNELSFSGYSKRASCVAEPAAMFLVVIDIIALSRPVRPILKITTCTGTQPVTIRSCHELLSEDAQKTVRRNHFRGLCTLLQT